MQGMNRVTGTSLAGIDHLRQSIEDILTTPLGSRVMRRNYGSRLYQLVDEPINRVLLVEIYTAVAEALGQWEPRFELTRVRVASIRTGQVVIDLDGVYRPQGTPLTLVGLNV